MTDHTLSRAPETHTRESKEDMCRGCSMMQFMKRPLLCFQVDPFVHSGLQPLTVFSSLMLASLRPLQMLWWEKERKLCLQVMILQFFFLAVILTWHCAVVIFTITEWCAVIFGIRQYQNIWMSVCTAPLFKWAEYYWPFDSTKNPTSGNLQFKGCKSATVYILNIYITRIVCFWSW